MLPGCLKDPRSAEKFVGSRSISGPSAGSSFGESVGLGRTFFGASVGIAGGVVVSVWPPSAVGFSACAGAFVAGTFALRA